MCVAIGPGQVGKTCTRQSLMAMQFAGEGVIHSTRGGEISHLQVDSVDHTTSTEPQAFRETTMRRETDRVLYRAAIQTMAAKTSRNNEEEIQAETRRETKHEQEKNPQSSLAVSDSQVHSLKETAPVLEDEDPNQVETQEIEEPEENAADPRGAYWLISFLVAFPCFYNSLLAKN